MSIRLLTAALSLLMLSWSINAADSKADAAKAKAALQELGEFVGQWKSNGEGVVDGKKAIWKEVWEFGWKFNKEGDAWIQIKISDSKFFTKGEVRYDVAKKVYNVKMTDTAEKESLYSGKLVRGALQLEYKDTATEDVHRMTLSTAANGIRLVAKYDVQEGGRGLASNKYKTAGNKEGESFAGGGKKKNECIVTGGLGTIAVSFMGKTYYVCCSGCKEEFDENPKKYVDEFEKKK